MWQTELRVFGGIERRGLGPCYRFLPSSCHIPRKWYTQKVRELMICQLWRKTRIFCWQFNKNIIRVVAVLISSCCMMSLCACTSNNTQQNNKSGLHNVSFMLSWIPDTNHIGVYVAKHMGWFKQAGLHVNILAVSQTGACLLYTSDAADDYS